MFKFVILIFVFYCPFGFAKLSFASDIQTITTLSRMDGNAFGHSFSKLSLNSFLEYGYSKKTSFGSTFQLLDINSEYQNRNKGYALTNPELFTRYKLYAGKKTSIIMQNSFKFGGLYNENNNLALMPRQYDYEFRILVPYNFKNRLVNQIVHRASSHFIRVELAYRQRFENPFNEVRFALLASHVINDKLSILFQDNINWQIQSKPLAKSNTYDNFKITNVANDILSLSALYSYNPRTALQLGFAKRIAGNAPFYDARGIFVGLWHATT